MVSTGCTSLTCTCPQIYYPVRVWPWRFVIPGSKCTNYSGYRYPHVDGLPIKLHSSFVRTETRINTGCTRENPSRKHLEYLLTIRRSSSAILQRLGIRIPSALSEARLPLTPSQELTACCDPCELSNTKKHVIARSLRRNTRLEYHGLPRNHPHSQLVPG